MSAGFVLSCCVFFAESFQVVFQRFLRWLIAGLLMVVLLYKIAKVIHRYLLSAGVGVDVE